MGSYRTAIILMLHQLLLVTATSSVQGISTFKEYVAFKDDEYPSNNQGNLSMLLDMYPQFTSEYPCSQHFQFSMLNALQQNYTDLFFQMPHYYLDIGRAKGCSKYGGQYMQFTYNMSHLPTRVPIGLCLPKECNTTELFDESLLGFNTLINRLFDKQKTNPKINFDKLYDNDLINKMLYSHSGFQDQLNTKNIMQILANDTQFNFRARVMEDGQSKRQKETSTLWHVTLIYGILAVLLLVIVPNSLLTAKVVGLFHPERNEKLEFLKRRQKMNKAEVMARELVDEDNCPDFAVKNPTLKQEQYFNNAIHSNQQVYTFKSTSPNNSRHQSLSQNQSRNQSRQSHQSRNISQSTIEDQSPNMKKKQNNTSNISGIHQDLSRNRGSDHVKDYEKIDGQMSGFADFFYQMNSQEAYRHLSQTKSKPWDDRELDLVDGFRVMNFCAGGIATMTITYFYATFNSWWGPLRFLQKSTAVSFICAYACIDAFLFFGVFLQVNRCYQILDAMHLLNKQVSILDYFKLIGRKFCRLAPTYYILWIFLWCLNSRMVSGPNWYNGENPFVTCADRWWPTVFWIENLYPQPEGPMVGCMPQAFPFQLDMQFALFTPFFAFITYKLKKRENLIICLIFIIAGFAINFALTWLYEFKIGLLHRSNFMLIQILIMKPWTHIHNFGLGILMAQFYRDLQLYRREQDENYRAYKYPQIQWMMTNKWFKQGSIPIGMTIFVTILAFCGPQQANPAKESQFVDCIFHSFLKVFWVISIMINMMGIFTGNYRFMKVHFSHKAMVMLAKSIPTGQLIQCMIMYIFISSWTNESGMYMTFPFTQAQAMGFFIFTFVIGLLLFIFLEFPYLRIYHIYVLPYLTHDDLLQQWHEQILMEVEGPVVANPDIALEQSEQIMGLLQSQSLMKSQSLMQSQNLTQQQGIDFSLRESQSVQVPNKQGLNKYTVNQSQTSSVMTNSGLSYMKMSNIGQSITSQTNGGQNSQSKPENEQLKMDFDSKKK